MSKNIENEAILGAGLVDNGMYVKYFPLFGRYIIKGVCSTSLKIGEVLFREIVENVDKSSKYCQSETVIRAAEYVDPS